MAEPATAKKRPRLGLTSQILIGLFAGIAVGIFFGEYCAPLKWAGEAFIGLLQMTVLPYITIALIANVGRLSLASSRRFAVSAIGVLLFFWLLAIVGLIVMPWALPEWKSAAFFSTSMLKPPAEIDFLSLFIPANPFHALANNIIPAVVLFSLCLGAAIIGMKNKLAIIEQLDFLTHALGRVNSFVVRLTPYGIFVIAADVAGTMSIAEFGRLQAYLATYSVAVLVMCFWLLPMLVAACTPFSYREVIAASRDAMITAFATAKLFVVLPLLIEQSKELLHRHQLVNTEADAEIEALVPLAYPFPNSGKLLSLLFIPFTAWFVDHPLEIVDYPRFIAAGVTSYFGSPTVAMPFLLDLHEYPADMFQLFLAAGVYGSRMGDMLGAMHLLAFTLICTCLLNGWLKIRLGRVLFVLATTLGLSLCAVIGTRFLLTHTLRDVYDRDEVIANMQLLLYPSPTVPSPTVPSPTVPSPTVDRQNQPQAAARKPGETHLEKIRRSGVLRVGYHVDNLPFSFTNAQGELVGFDIDMAHLLAREIDCKIQFVPLQFSTLAEQLANDEFDLAMSGIAITTPRLEQMRFANPYMKATLAFVVRDYRRRQFARRERIQKIGSLKIGIPQSSYFHDKLQRYLPEAEIVPLESPRTFFENSQEDLDGILLSAEAGSAWTLLYPDFQVVIPFPDVVEVPLAYPVSQRDEAFAHFLSQWLELKKEGLEYPMIYDHWILGKTATQHQPRWSIIRNVLHWVD
jgi:Na+/H+-dicarboxylate symporter/ABC-type amino acid transport substrate-binding protein